LLVPGILWMLLDVRLWGMRICRGLLLRRLGGSASFVIHARRLAEALIKISRASQPIL
jgi:hypothetical protein